MRRSFKEHIRGFCHMHGYPYEESGEGSGWVMDIGGGTVTIRQDKDQYEIRAGEIVCESKPSAWDIAALVIEYHMDQKNNS